PFQTLPAPSREQIRMLALSPDNRRIAIAVSDPLKEKASYLGVVDLATKREVCHFPEKLVERLVWDPRGNLLGVSELKERFKVSTTLQGCVVFRRDWTLVNRATAGFSTDGRFAVLGGPNRNGGPSLLVDLDRLDDYLATNDYNNGNLKLEDIDRAA